MYGWTKTSERKRTLILSCRLVVCGNIKCRPNQSAIPFDDLSDVLNRFRALHFFCFLVSDFPAGSKVAFNDNSVFSVSSQGSLLASTICLVHLGSRNEHDPRSFQIFPVITRDPSLALLNSICTSVAQNWHRASYLECLLSFQSISPRRNMEEIWTSSFRIWHSLILCTVSGGNVLCNSGVNQSYLRLCAVVLVPKYPTCAHTGIKIFDHGSPWASVCAGITYSSRRCSKSYLDTMRNWKVSLLLQFAMVSILKLSSRINWFKSVACSRPWWYRFMAIWKMVMSNRQLVDSWHISLLAAIQFGIEAGPGPQKSNSLKVNWLEILWKAEQCAHVIWSGRSRSRAERNR